MPHEQFEVLVIDNGSSESPRELVESYPFCKYLEEEAPGSYAARNRGIDHARGEIIAFTDADCLPDKDWLNAGVRAIQGLEEPGLVGGAIEVFPHDSRKPTGAEWFDCVFGLQQDQNVSLFSFAATANAFTTVSIIQAVGKFNEALKSGGDTEWGHRVAAAGFAVEYEPKAKIRHPARRTIKEILIQSRRHAGGRVIKAAEQPQTKSLARKVYTGLLLLMPPVNLFGRAAEELRKRDAGWWPLAQVCTILMFRRYTLLWETLRVKLGASPERR